MGLNRLKIKFGCFHTGHCVVDPRVSEPQTRGWFGRTHVALMSQAGPEILCTMNLYISNTWPVGIVGTAVAHVKALIKTQCQSGVQPY